jgi:hypothetical protein
VPTVISNGLISIAIPTLLSVAVIGSFALPDEALSRRERHVFRALLISLVALLLVHTVWIVFLRFTAATPSARYTLIDIAVADLVVDFLVLCVTAVIGVWVIGKLRNYLRIPIEHVRGEPEPPDSVPISWKDLLKAIVAFSAVSLLLSIMTATLAIRPPLPEATIDRARNAESVEGTLLTHKEGFWYVLTQEQVQVVAIPDNKVSDVHLHPKANGSSFP